MTILSDGALSGDLTTLPCYGGTKDLADSQEVSQAEGGLFRVHEAGIFAKAEGTVLDT